MIPYFGGTRRAACTLAAGLALTLAAASPSLAAARIQQLISPGGIEAWFVRDTTLPLIAMEFAFSGGAAQDPETKPGVANLVADLLDEGAGDLDSKSYHERLDRGAIEQSFGAGYDALRGSMRMLREDREEAFDLLRMALTSPRFDPADVERVRSQVIAGLRRDFDLSDLDRKPQALRDCLRQSSLRPTCQRHRGKHSYHHRGRHQGLCRAGDSEGHVEDRSRWRY